MAILCSVIIILSFIKDKIVDTTFQPSSLINSNLESKVFPNSPKGSQFFPMITLGVVSEVIQAKKLQVDFVLDGYEIGTDRIELNDIINVVNVKMEW